MGNMGLYFEGLLAKIIQCVGVTVLFIGIFVMTASIALGILVMIIGIALFLYGKAKRFDYQRRSGHIIHRGD